MSDFNNQEPFDPFGEKNQSDQGGYDTQSTPDFGTGYQTGQTMPPEGQQGYDSQQNYGSQEYDATPPYQMPYQAQQGQPYMNQPPMYEQKSKIAAGLFGIFLGCFGVHNFYLGFTGKAVAQLLLTLIGGWVCGLGVAAASIWGLIEGIMILSGSIKVDAHGVPLKD